MWIHLAYIMMTVGSYHTIPVNDSVQNFSKALHINDYLEKNGYNSIVKKWTVEEAAEQIVNGKNVILRLLVYNAYNDSNSTALSMCVKVFVSRDNDVEIKRMKPCSSWIEIIDDV